jgi:drug/metabolite transporter (DMT)-like permease
VPKKLRGWILVRIIFGLTSFCCFTFCIGLLPLSLLMVLVQTNPFWTAVLAYFLNNELLSKLEIVGMLISFMGVMTISFST